MPSLNNVFRTHIYKTTLKSSENISRSAELQCIQTQSLGTGTEYVAVPPAMYKLRSYSHMGSPIEE